MSEIILVTGAAASGKSALAEQICCRQGSRRLYIATMQPSGEGAEKRIGRHREMRAGKGFDTLECYTALEQIPWPSGYDTALLEDTGNLVANLLYREQPCTLGEITAGILHVAQQVQTLVVVGNEVFSGVETVALDDYLHTMGAVHQALAQQASTVIESICGLAHVLKDSRS